MIVSSLEIFKKYIKPQNQQKMYILPDNFSPQIKYRTNFTNCINEAFQLRNYQKVSDDEWTVVWSEKDGLNQIYQKRLQQDQRVNHFRNYFEMCKKDNLIRNLKKHKKALEKDNRLNQAKQYSFFPQTYLLPSQYVIFADEFKRNQVSSLSSNQNVWIMKPTGKSQGKGIFLISKLSQLSQWQASPITQQTPIQPYIIQRYINNPLLIGNKKFDIRLYVLVTCYNPLTVYLYRNGFARFTHARYDETKLNDNEIHLTNVAIQKQSQNYDENIGGKWYLDKLKLYLLSKYGEHKVTESFIKIEKLIIKTLEAMVKVIGNTSDKNNSFQLYGFDVLLDSTLNPWLIEVNGSPSMTANTQNDRVLKVNLLDDTLTVLNFEKFLTGEEQQVGGFDLICKKYTQEKPKNNSKSSQQSISLLGTMLNREDNYKKLGKINANRINQIFQSLPSSNYVQQPSKKTTLIVSTPTVPKDRRRVMSQTNNQTPLQSLSDVNKKHALQALGASRRNMPITPQVPKQGAKDFVIKQQKNMSFISRKQKPLNTTTNQNELIK